MLVTLAEMHRVPRGEIVVSANEGTCLHILPEVFAEFKRQYPSVAVNVKRLEHNKILEAIIDNSCDFGIVSMPVPDKRLTVVPIHRDELIVITPPHHPLAGQKKATVAEVVEYPLLLPKVGRTRDALEALFHERRLKPIVSMELDSSELLKRFVAADVGVGFIPRSHVAEDLQAKALAALTLADASIQRDLALVFRKDKALSRAALAFIDIAVKLKSAVLAAALLADRPGFPNSCPLMLFSHNRLASRVLFLTIRLQPISSLENVNWRKTWSPSASSSPRAWGNTGNGLPLSNWRCAMRALPPRTWCACRPSSLPTASSFRAKTD